MRKLQTEVTSVISMVDRISVDKQLGARKRQQMQSLTRTLLTIIHDMSSIPKNVRFHVLTVIQDVVKEFRPLAGSKSLAFFAQISTADLTGLEVFGDRSRLQQLLSILLRNSIRATPRGYVFLTVQKGPPTPECASLKFVVEDNGRGTEGSVETMEMDCIHHELGLAKSIVEAMEGRMSLYSTPGTGTGVEVRLTFKLPIE